MKRDNQGRFRINKTPIIMTTLLVLVGIFVFYLGTKPILYVESKVIKAEVVVKDNITKLTENLADKMRQQKGTEELLFRSENAYLKAVEINEIALEELNVAVESLNLYQGLK